MNRIISCTVVLSLGLAAAQPPVAQTPPRNSHLPDTPYPIFHADGWASDVQPLRGPESGDKLAIDFVRTGGASRWLLFGPRASGTPRPTGWVWPSGSGMTTPFLCPGAPTNPFPAAFSCAVFRV